MEQLSVKYTIQAHEIVIYCRRPPEPGAVARAFGSVSPAALARIYRGLGPAGQPEIAGAGLLLAGLVRITLAI